MRTFSMGIACAALLVLSGCGGSDRVVVGSKNFTEQVILGELLAQHLENHTELTVDRRLNLGARSYAIRD